MTHFIDSLRVIFYICIVCIKLHLYAVTYVTWLPLIVSLSVQAVGQYQTSLSTANHIYIPAIYIVVAAFSEIDQSFILCHRVFCLCCTKHEVHKDEIPLVSDEKVLACPFWPTFKSSRHTHSLNTASTVYTWLLESVMTEKHQMFHISIISLCLISLFILICILLCVLLHSTDAGRNTNIHMHRSNRA